MHRSIHIRIKSERVIHTITDSTGRELRRFELADDLDAALQLLKRVNAVQLVDGTQIWKLRMAHGFSAWSFHQGSLFWDHLRHFIFYKPLIDFVVEHGYSVEVSGDEKAELLRVLELSGVRMVKGNVTLRRLSTLRTALLNVVLAFFANVVGFAALVFAPLRRRKVLVYSPDTYDLVSGSDFRMREIYRFLSNRKVPYIEVFHTLLGRVFVKNLVKRKRLGLYLEHLPFASLFSLTGIRRLKIQLGSIDASETEYCRNIISLYDRYARISVLRVRSLRRLIRMMGVEKLITIDDMRSQEVIAAMKSLGRSCYAFQHGHINRYHAGHMFYGIPQALVPTFDTLFVWNEYWREKLVGISESYTHSNVAIGGELRPLQPIEFTRRPLPQSPKEMSILVVNDTWARREEVTPFVERLLDLGIKVQLSLRSDLSVEKQLKDFGLGPEQKFETSYGISKEMLESVDAVAGVYSTFIREVLYYGLPAFAFQTAFSFGYDLVEDRLASPLKKVFTFDEMKRYMETAESKKSVLWPDPGVTIAETLARLLPEYVR